MPVIHQDQLRPLSPEKMDELRAKSDPRQPSQLQHLVLQEQRRIAFAEHAGDADPAGIGSKPEFAEKNWRRFFARCGRDAQAARRFAGDEWERLQRAANGTVR